jgi:hypothetical protein
MRVCNQSHSVSFARDDDAHELITCWKFGSFYIYSTPSIPTTETTHGFYEENFIEEKDASREKASHCTPRCEEGPTERAEGREEGPTQGAPQALTD